MSFCAVQLYVPPAKMINKDFLKQVLREKKKLLQLNEVKYVNVPHYDELSVKRFWPILREDETLMHYMPDFTAEDKLPDRVYFWNVANTVQNVYVQNVIKYANNQRMKAQDEAAKQETIEISAQWWDKLNSMPFVSCKCCGGFLNYHLAYPFMCRTQGKDVVSAQRAIEASTLRS